MTEKSTFIFTLCWCSLMFLCTFAWFLVGLLTGGWGGATVGFLLAALVHLCIFLDICVKKG